MPINGEQIVGAVCRALHAAHPEVPVYREPIDQDFREPCFFVWNSGTETAPVIWPKYRETHRIEVRYYPPDRNTQHGEGLDIGARLIETLAKVHIVEEGRESLPIWATEYARRIIDDAVAVSVTYRTEGFFYETRAGSMGGLDARTVAKE